MKKLVLFSTILLQSIKSQKLKQICDSPPELSSKSTWLCDPINGPWKSGSICSISGDGCSGQVKCKNGKWKGKTNKFCPKNCPTPPEPPKFGAKWVCWDGHHSSCKLEPFLNYNCTNSVTCNTKSGEWRGKIKCKFTGQKNNKKNLPDRPDGEYDCGNNGKCNFVCDDGRNAGRVYFNKKSGNYEFETKFDYCVPETTTTEKTSTTSVPSFGGGAISTTSVNVVETLHPGFFDNFLPQPSSTVPTTTITTTTTSLTTTTMSDSFCKGVNCQDDEIQNFDRCANFDENDCSDCDQTRNILGSDRKNDGVNIKTLKKPFYKRLDGIIKKCNNLKLRFKLYIRPDLSDTTENGQSNGYSRHFLKFSQNPDIGSPDDSRVGFALDAHNRLNFWYNSYDSKNNQGTMFKQQQVIYWGQIKNDGLIDYLQHPTVCDPNDSSCKQHAITFKKDKTYHFELEWKKRCKSCNYELVLMIQGQGENMGVAKITDYKFGEYFCENYQDLLVTFGADTEMRSAPQAFGGRIFKNLEAEIYDVIVDGLCPVQKHPKEEKCCPCVTDRQACLATKNFVKIENWSIDQLGKDGLRSNQVTNIKGEVGKIFIFSRREEIETKCRRDPKCIGYGFSELDKNKGQLVYTQGEKLIF